MNTVVYYFSGTGNSLIAARYIAEKTGAALIPISSVIKQTNITNNADAIGIVFPVYFRAVLGGIPLIVQRFIGKLTNISSKYIFAVGTYGLGLPDFLVLKEAIELRDGKLAAGFGVKMPFYYLSLSGQGSITSKKLQQITINSEKKLQFICDRISIQKESKIERNSFLIKLIIPLGKLYYSQLLKKLTNTKIPLIEHILWMDYNFSLNEEKCNGCETCVSICPVNNIIINNHKPVWQHHCEQCCACIQWCPNEAIWFGNRPINGKRNHHPDTTISDIDIFAEY